MQLCMHNIKVALRNFEMAHAQFAHSWPKLDPNHSSDPNPNPNPRLRL